MKAIVASTLLLCTFVLATGDLQCSNIEPFLTNPRWDDMVDPCVRVMRQQIKTELGAAMQYLAMGAHFSRDVVNRPGFANLFFEAASEERQHAIKLISYLLMRGELLSDVSTLIDTKALFGSEKKITTEWGTGLDALKDALRLEANVTKEIKNVIEVCEGQTTKKRNSPDSVNDYHLVDYLTGEFLEEQYKGQRDLAGKVSTLSKFMTDHGALGEFLYDKKLLNGEL